ncbi:MAG TPA: prenyltransferase [Spirochaetia bacterium]|nr:prenyltransferase [Spirochaetia bacterium]
MRPSDGLGKVKAWLALSRLPFHTVGVLPYVLGLILARRVNSSVRWDIFAWGVGGVVLIMLAAYYGGEYWDWEEDAISERSPFAGGSKVLQAGTLKRLTALIASIVCLVLALGVGVLLQFGHGTGPWTIPLCLTGLFGGFCYSARPVRWVGRGLGELWIAFCYGWLPVATGFYLQTGYFSPTVHWMALPVGLSIFNVILLNEFLDYSADRQTAKTNLVVRLGQSRAAILFALVTVLSWVTFVISVRNGVPWKALWLYTPVFLLSAVLIFFVLRGSWRHRAALERLCGFNMAVNLGTTGVFIAAIAF